MILVQFAPSHFTSEVRKTKSRKFKLQMHNPHTGLSQLNKPHQESYLWSIWTPLSLSLSLRAPCLASQKNKINSRYWLAQAYQNIYKCIWQFTYVSPHGELSQSCCQHCCLALPRFPGTALPSPPLPGDAKESPGSSRAALCCVMPEEFIPAFFPGEGIVKILLGSLSAEHFLKLFPDISPETQIPLSFHC